MGYEERRAKPDRCFLIGERKTRGEERNKTSS